MLVHRDSFGGKKCTKNLYSLCSNYILFATTTGIFVYTKTGQLLHKIDLAHCKATQMNPANHVQAYFCTVDTVHLYDFKMGVLIQKWTFEQENIENIYAHKGKLYLLSLKTVPFEKEQRQVEIQVTFVKELDLVKKSLRDIFYIENQLINSISFCNQKCLVVLQNSVTFFYTADLETGQLDKIETKYQVTCIATHPTIEVAAVGDINGRIILFYNVFEPEIRAHTIMHWHAYKVNDLEFTNDGNYLISGGNEATLVIWQLNTGHKQFLPRLGGEIYQVQISADQEQYAVGLSNNSIILISVTDVSQRKVISGIQQAHLDDQLYPPSIGIKVDPKTGYIVMNGSTSSLQFLDSKTGQTTLELDLSIRNRTTFGKQVSIQPHIVNAVFSPLGDWLVTVDQKEAPEFPQETFLKFWYFDQESQEYLLNTRVDAPHGKYITGLAFSPIKNGAPLTCATCSSDGTFKIWELVIAKNERETGIFQFIIAFWKCKSFSGYKNLSARGVAYSEDGSLLAVGFDAVVTLWNPSLNTLEKTLLVPGLKKSESILNMTFINYHLAVYTQATLHVWSLLSCSIIWSIRTKVQSIVKDLYSSKFACSVISDKSGCVFVFEPDSPAPIQTIPLNAKPLGLAYCPSASKEAALVCFDKNYELSRFTIGEEQTPKQSLPKIEKSLFASMYGSQNTIRDQVFATSIEKVDPTSLEFLDIAPHILPAPSKLVSKFLRGFLDSNPVPEHIETVEQDIPEKTDVVMKDPVKLHAIYDVSFLGYLFNDIDIKSTVDGNEDVDKVITFEKPKVVKTPRNNLSTSIKKTNPTPQKVQDQTPSKVRMVKSPVPYNKNLKKRSLS